MKRYIYLIIILFGFILLACEGDAITIGVQKTVTVYQAKDRFETQKGDVLKSISSDAKITVSTDTQTGISSVEVLAGLVELTKLIQ